ncbi:hypothetical protein K3758_08165 [Sulfitobacter sp. W002]|uniref:hypothetical protein n=1 Tax=Sulfitobacter sp. W002 TaxID=2867024 RepID=UPI0021A2AEB3|nr:hypothetical protein [Sulfitobacter sp. W002]UWR31462.1 hypothetical protein K3758_08165 [Sulfitobacter sp. W002]
MAKRTRHKSGKPEAVKADFHAALDRLIAGKPKSKELKSQAALGRLRINATNLAKEAGRSAALIWRPFYADVKERLESLSAPKRQADVPPTVSAIRELREALKQQMEDAKRHWVDTVDLHTKLAKKESEIETYRSDMEQLSKDAHKLRVENAKLREQLHGTNIATFPSQKK